MKDTVSLGIESTSHTFGIGICKGRKIMANARSMYVPETGWGIKPVEAARHHEKAKDDVLEKALSEAGVSLDDIDIVSIAAGPGLPPCLRVGVELAKTLGK